MDDCTLITYPRTRVAVSMPSNSPRIYPSHISLSTSPPQAFSLRLPTTSPALRDPSIPSSRQGMPLYPLANGVAYHQSPIEHSCCTSGCSDSRPPRMYFYPPDLNLLPPAPFPTLSYLSSLPGMARHVWRLCFFALSLSLLEPASHGSLDFSSTGKLEVSIIKKAM